MGKLWDIRICHILETFYNVLIGTPYAFIWF